MITVEDLNIRGMLRNRYLFQSIIDVAWGNFFLITKRKAENAGRTFERVDPRYTSQICSNCSSKQAMPLAVRMFECSNCGIVIDRDHNAAINIDRAGQARISTPVERCDSVSKKRERDKRSQRQDCD
jgi:putative transposase